MTTRDKVWRNGEFIAWDQATVHVLSHAFSRASAIFDFFKIYETDDGPAAFRIDDHIDRLFYSAKLLGMNLAYNKERIKQAALETIKENKVRQGFVKIIAYWSEEAILKLVPDADLDIDIFAISEKEREPFPHRNPIKACISKWRKIPPECLPVKAKACAHYLNGMLARADAQREGFDVGILLDTRGFVAECSIETLFMIQNTVLVTPNLGWILKGISRQTILEIALDDGIEVDERPIAEKELFTADEIFTSTTPSRVQAVSQIDGHIFNNAPGPLSVRISKLCAEVVQGKIPKYNKWLTYV
ncbi:MAG: aminotransferase class IV [Pseudomonadota bacterium]